MIVNGNSKFLTCRPPGPLPALLCALLAVAIAGACATRRPEVPYVPTPQPVVGLMLEIASVRADDVLYDLGSGDGRIVIAAARRFGTRGVGYDIDPVRVREANEYAQRAGVSDKVRFVHGDIFEADIGEATVVTLYLLPAVNLRLRPKLLRELRPGTRIVSHAFDMGDWKPQDTRLITVNDIVHTVYFWTISSRPAARSFRVRAEGSQDAAGGRAWPESPRPTRAYRKLASTERATGSWW